MISMANSPQNGTFQLKNHNELMPANTTRIGLREMYYYLVNIDEHPEIVPLAYDFVAARLNASARFAPDDSAIPATFNQASDCLNEVLGLLSETSYRWSRPWQVQEEVSRRKVFHYFLQYLPIVLVDGCWLQSGLRVSLAHTPLGASLTGLYQHQVRAVAGEPSSQFVEDYRAVHNRLAGPLEELASRSFINRADLSDTTLPLPIFLLGIAQFTRRFGAEVLGLNLAWQFMGLSGFGLDLIRDMCAAYALPALGDDHRNRDHVEKGRVVAREAAIQFLKNSESLVLADTWKAIQRGINAGVSLWTEWFDQAYQTWPSDHLDPKQEMIDLLWRKAPYACGYHAAKKLGTKTIDEHLAKKTFDGPALLAELAGSRWVKPGDSSHSALLKILTAFGGPMLSVFSPSEVQVIKNWIDSLPTEHAETRGLKTSETTFVEAVPSKPIVRKEEREIGFILTPKDFCRKAVHRYRKCSARELYYYLINVEFHTDILPVAERFARDHLERSFAMIWKGGRPIPSLRYDPAELERWVHQKHREQVDSYRTFDKRPEVNKEAFIEATVQLAPLILIDGGWLQGIASPTLIHTAVGRLLFHVLIEELGEGNAASHHANIYRDLLEAMQVNAPPVDSWDFARWLRLNDSSFDVPTLWLSISLFPRHFLPEILGLNLAVELAGVGGPYMEARDTLRRFGYPSLFVDVHNAADNVSVGHAAWAMNAICRYMDERAEREGPHNLDHTWQRIWAGVCATLPQVGRVRLLAHRIGKRLSGEGNTRIPQIFPT
jgi:Iron-containing redox enzyme